MSDNSYNVANTRDLFAMQKGFVEDITDPKGSGRVKVRIINKEFRTGDAGQFIPVPATADLPWAGILMPVNASGGTATSCSSHNIKVGDIVWCIFVNGDSRQRLVVGSQGAVANASTKKPEGRYAPLQRYVSQDKKTGDAPNPAMHVTADQQEKNKNLGTKPLGAHGDEDQNRAVSGLDKPYGPGNPAGEFQVAVADGKCATNPASKMDIILAEFFGAVQNTNGNVGSYYISKYTGELFDIQRIAKGYIARVQSIVEALISRAFGELMAKLKEVIQKLIQALLAPLPGCLKQVVDWFTQALEKMGCSMNDIFETMGDFIQSTLEGYIGSVVNWAACQTKRLVDGILGKVLGEITNIIDSIFGSISSVLGAIGSIGDVVGGAISSVMDILGISCTGTAACSSGPDKKSTKSGTFSGLKAGYNDLDEILQGLQDGNQFPINGVCDAATVPAPPLTEVNVWGAQGFDDIDSGDLDDEDDIDDLNDDDDSKKRKRKNRRNKKKKGGRDDGDDPGGRARKITRRKRKARCAQRYFRVGDARGTKGDIIDVSLIRNGDQSSPSAVSYYTVDGTAKAGEDYCPESGYMGFGTGQGEGKIKIKTINAQGEGQSAFGEVAVTIEFFVDDDVEEKRGSAVDGFSIGDKTFNRKFINEPHTVTKTVKLVAPIRDTEKKGRENRKYPIKYINLDSYYKEFPIKVSGKRNKILLDDNIINGFDLNARIEIKKVVGGTARFTDNGRQISVQARPKPKRDKDETRIGGIKDPGNVRVKADKNGCKYFYVKMKMNDSCGKIRKKTGVVIICPPTVEPPPITPPPIVPEVTPPPPTPPPALLDIPYYSLTPNRSSVYEGEVVKFELDTVNVDTGTDINFTVGRAETGITWQDIAWIEHRDVKVYPSSDSDLAGTFTVDEQGGDSIRIRLKEDGVAENQGEVAEQIIVQLNGLGVSAGCLVLDQADDPSSPGTTPTITILPERPTIKTCEQMDIDIFTTNISDGTNIPYSIFGTNLNEDDIVQDTEGTIYIENNRGKFVLEIACDRIATGPPSGPGGDPDDGSTGGIPITFTIPDFGSSTTIVLEPNDDDGSTGDTSGGDDNDRDLFDFDEDDLNDGDGYPRNPPSPADDGAGNTRFGAPIIDGDGGIIDIPVLDSGNRYLAPPFMSIESNTGFGAFVEPIINSDGYLTRVRVRRGGQGYTGQNRPSNVICQLVGIVLTNVGGLYDTAPQVFVDGDSTIAKATISPEGFVNGIILLRADEQYTETPDVIITGGGGFGAKAKADLQCIPEDQSELILQSLAKDPANYVDCP